MVNKKENTTMIIPKVLRDSLSVLKFKYHIDELHQVVQLLYNMRNEKEFKQTKIVSEKDEQQELIQILGTKHDFWIDDVDIKKQLNEMSIKDLKATIKRCEEVKE